MYTKKKVYQALRLAKERLPDLDYSNSDEWVEDKPEATLNEFDKLCEKCS